MRLLQTYRSLAWAMNLSLIAALTITMPSTTLAQATQPGSTGPVMMEVKPGIYHFRMKDYGSLVVVTADGVIVVDPNGEERARALRQAIRNVTSKPVTTVIYSHAHFDHSRGGRVFKEEGARFITHARCVELLERDVEQQVVLPDQTYDVRHRIELGGKKVDLHYFGANDDQCMSIIHLPDDKVLFAVDWHLQGYLNEPYRLNQHDYVGTLNTLRRVHKELSFDTVVSSHMPSSSPQQLAEDLAFNEALFVAVRAGLEQGKSVEELSRTIKLPQFQHWYRYDQNLPAHVARMAYSIWHGH